MRKNLEDQYQPLVTNFEFLSGWISCHISSQSSRIKIGDLTIFLWFAAEETIAEM